MTAAILWAGGYSASAQAIYISGKDAPKPEVAAPASPAPALPQGPHVIVTEPVWLRQPTRDDLLDFYPARAQRTEVSGSAEVFCSFNATGTLTACKVLKETPTEYGFGEAAIKASRLFRLSVPDGLPAIPWYVGYRLDFKLAPG